MFRFGDSELNLHFPLLQGGGHTKGIQTPTIGLMSLSPIIYMEIMGVDRPWHIWKLIYSSIHPWKRSHDRLENHHFQQEIHPWWIFHCSFRGGRSSLPPKKQWISQKKRFETFDIQTNLLRLDILGYVFGRSSHTFSVSVFGCLGKAPHSLPRHPKSSKYLVSRCQKNP